MSIRDILQDNFLFFLRIIAFYVVRKKTEEIYETYFCPFRDLMKVEHFKFNSPSYIVLTLKKIANKCLALLC